LPTCRLRTPKARSALPQQRLRIRRNVADHHEHNAGARRRYRASQRLRCPLSALRTGLGLTRFRSALGRRSAWRCRLVSRGLTPERPRRGRVRRGAGRRDRAEREVRRTRHLGSRLRASAFTRSHLGRQIGTMPGGRVTTEPDVPQHAQHKPDQAAPSDAPRPVACPRRSARGRACPLLPCAAHDLDCCP